jgi:DNA-binding HxlR family transcriptional regulator
MSSPHTLEIVRNDHDAAEATLQVLQRRWAIRIITLLATQDLQFLALLRRIPGLRHKVLIEQLRFLAGRGVIERLSNPPDRRVIYRLTDKGRQLLTIIDAMRAWQ